MFGRCPDFSDGSFRIAGSHGIPLNIYFLEFLLGSIPCKNLGHDPKPGNEADDADGEGNELKGVFNISCGNNRSNKVDKIQILKLQASKEVRLEHIRRK